MAKIEVKNFAEASHVITQLARRSFKSVVGMFSPVILGFSNKEVGEDGLLVQRLIPCAGTLTTITVFVVGVTKEKKLQLNIEVDDFSGVLNSTTVMIKEEHFDSKLEIAIPAKSLISIRISDTSFKMVHVAAIFVPNIGGYKAHKYLHDVIEGAVDEGIRDIPIEADASGPAD